MDEPYLGMVCLFPWDFETRGWLKCEGQTLPANQYQTLFALLGNKFGGDGHSNFMLPNLPDIQAETGTLSYYIATEGMWPSCP